MVTQFSEKIAVLNIFNHHKNSFANYSELYLGRTSKRGHSDELRKQNITCHCKYKTIEPYLRQVKYGNIFRIGKECNTSKHFKVIGKIMVWSNPDDMMTSFTNKFHEECDEIVITKMEIFPLFLWICYEKNNILDVTDTHAHLLAGHRIKCLVIMKFQLIKYGCNLSFTLNEKV